MKNLKSRNNKLADMASLFWLKIMPGTVTIAVLIYWILTMK